MEKYKIAVLDDYQNVALKCADWSVLRDRADITVFQDHLADPKAVIERLLLFDVVCVMRERTPLPRNVIERLPNLKLIASTGSGNASIDVAAAADHGITVVHTGYRSDPTVEFTWALILASARHIVTESNSVRSCGWQQTVGTDLRGKTLGVLGLGNVGSQVARIGSAFGMNLIAWSQNMTPEAAKAAGAILVSKDQLFEQSDILTIHLVLSSRTRALVGAVELRRMKPTARLINTSRGPIVDEQALISVLKNKQIAGAAIDVFDIEPLPSSHPFRTLDNVLATPHIGYVSHRSLRDVLRGYRLEYSEVARHSLTKVRQKRRREPPSIQSLRTTFMKSSTFRFMDALLPFRCLLHGDAGKEGQDHFCQYDGFHAGLLGFDISHDQVFNKRAVLCDDFPCGRWEHSELVHGIDCETAFLALQAVGREFQKALDVFPAKRLGGQEFFLLPFSGVVPQTLQIQLALIRKLCIEAGLIDARSLFQFLKARVREAILPEHRQRVLKHALPAEVLRSSHAFIVAY